VIFSHTIRTPFPAMLEVKMPGKQLTRMQEYQKDQWAKAGGIVWRVENVQEALLLVDALARDDAMKATG